MSEGAMRSEDGNWEPEKKEGGSMVPVIIGVAIGALGLCVCGGGILAAIAIPNFLAMQLRAKRAEAPTNVDAIRTAEKAYHAEWDVFTTVEACPPAWTTVGRDQVLWESDWDCYSQFEHLGWIPWGMTRCRYSVTAHNNPAGAASDDDFVIVSECDIDGDGIYSYYEANRAEKSTMTSPNNTY